MSDGSSSAAWDVENVARMRGRLEDAGKEGLVEGRLLGTGQIRRRQQTAALERLAQDGLAVKRKKGRGVMWFAAQHAPSVENVVANLRAAAVPRGAVAWTIVDLRKLLPPVQRELVADALSEMAALGEVWELRGAKGGKRFWLFSRSVKAGVQPPVAGA